MKMMYEKLLKIAGSARLEAMEDALQKLSPSDVGRKAYREIMAQYNLFGQTGNMEHFEAVANRLAAVTGYKI
jgi:hypothetical protein